MVDRIRASRIGPVADADISFGDVTIFVGPQATGKSIFLQLLKLLVDRSAIHKTMKRFGLAQRSNTRSFFDLYFGEGMASIWSEENSKLVLGRARKPTDLAAFARPSRASAPEKLFYIPAQRVMSLRDGMTRPFTDYRAGDPFVLRDFSEKLHGIVQNEIGIDEEVFPRQQRLAAALRRPLEKHIFGSFGLRTDTSGHQGRLVLNADNSLTAFPCRISFGLPGNGNLCPCCLGYIGYFRRPKSRRETLWNGLLSKNRKWVCIPTESGLSSTLLWNCDFGDIAYAFRLIRLMCWTSFGRYAFFKTTMEKFGMSCDSST